MINSINTQAIYNYYNNASTLEGIVTDNNPNGISRLNSGARQLKLNNATYLNRTKENRQKLIDALKGAAGGDSSSYSTLRDLEIQLPENATYGDPEVKKQLANLAIRLEAIESNRPSLNADAYSKGQDDQYNNLMVLQSQYKQRLKAQGVLDTTDLYGQSQIQGVQIDPTDIAGHTATIKESYDRLSPEFTTFSTKLKKEVDDRKAKNPKDPDTVRHIARATMQQLNNRIGDLANGKSREQVLEDAFNGKGNPEILAYMDLYKRAVGANLPTNEAQLQAKVGERQVQQASFWPTQEELKSVEGSKGKEQMFRLARAGNQSNAQVSAAIEDRQTRFLTLGGGQTLYKGSDGKLYLYDTDVNKQTWVQTTEVSQIKIDEETAKKYKGKGFADTDKRLSYDATIYSQKVDPKDKVKKGDLYATKVNYKDRKAVEKRRKDVISLATKADLKDSSASASPKETKSASRPTSTPVASAKASSSAPTSQSTAQAQGNTAADRSRAATRPTPTKS